MDSFIPAKKELFRGSFSNQREGMITSTRKETHRRKGVWREMKGVAAVRSATWVVDGLVTILEIGAQRKRSKVKSCSVRLIKHLNTTIDTESGVLAWTPRLAGVTGGLPLGTLGLTDKRCLDLRHHGRNGSDREVIG